MVPVGLSKNENLKEKVGPVVVIVYRYDYFANFSGLA